jgi:drug/metabolite transporter (DMT)-like permease
LALSYGTGFLRKDLVSLSGSKRLLLLVTAETITLILAELAIGFSITEKNATLAGLIEISYPIFIAIFAYFILKEKVSLTTIIGGILIFVGVFVIYYFNK